MKAMGRILVVDDNNILRAVVAKMLSRLGYDVSSADSGESGLRILDKNIFDVVLSDYEMPGLDGAAFARIIKKKSPQTRVLIMTGDGNEAFFLNKNNAADGIISKPFTMAKMDEALQSL